MTLFRAIVAGLCAIAATTVLAVTFRRRPVGGRRARGRAPARSERATSS